MLSAGPPGAPGALEGELAGGWLQPTLVCAMNTVDVSCNDRNPMKV